MPGRKTIQKQEAGSVTDQIPELLARALGRKDDFIITRETDPDTGKERIHVFSGKFVTGCMLSKLLGQAESRRDEGAVVLSGRWHKAR